MTVCIATNYLNPHCFYPVLDPRRTPGADPHAYGYPFAWDSVIVRVERKPGSSSCEMEVVLTSTLSQTKGILAWNVFRNSWTDSISTSGGGQQVSMDIRRAGAVGQRCGTGTDTVVLGRYDPSPWGWKALYCFPPQDFWDFWGGCKVTFEWFSDTHGSGLWGSQTPQPEYPLVQFPDGTLMREDLLLPDDRETTRFFVVFGGAGFSIGYGELAPMRLSAASAISFVPLPSTPADGTLVREWDRPEVYVTYGGAKFWIPDADTFYALGFDGSRVRVIPPGGTSQLRTMPIDGTLLREEKSPRLEGPRPDFLFPAHGVDPGVHLVDNQQLRRVTSTAAMEENCLPWRHVRRVPENSLAALQRGPDLGP
jgi:hypothetical protein